MNEDSLNIQIRQYLKKVGITSQRTIEQSIQKRIESGELSGSENLAIKMTLSVPTLNIDHQIEGQINLDD
jgi:hypothetical protein